MSDPTEDARELHDARDAVAKAKLSKLETDEIVAYAVAAHSGVVRIVKANGFVEKFRAIVQGGATV